MFVILSISRRIREGRKNLRLRHFFRLPAHLLQQSGQGWNESQDAPVPDGVLRALWHALSTDRVGRREHSDISVTMNVYTHLGLEDAAAEMARMEAVEAARREQAKLSGESDQMVLSQKMFKTV